jgi:tetratricopeptide (TPR) repeat protein
MHVRLQGLSIYLLLIFSILIIPVSSNQCYGCDLWDLALEYRDNGKYEEAISTFEEALFWAEKDSQETSEAKSAVWTEIGDTYRYNLKDYGQAIVAYKEAAQLVMNDGNTWNDLGQAQLLYALEMEDSLPKSPTANKYEQLAELFGNAINSMNMAKLNGKSVSEIDSAMDKQQYYRDLAKENR